ncbi:MAG: hypothetical protein PHQ05_07015 [Sterolibacterium sp.]|nr:hypothetical protein [Sterolibacterium sp.]
MQNKINADGALNGNVTVSASGNFIRLTSTASGKDIKLAIKAHGADTGHTAIFGGAVA